MSRDRFVILLTCLLVLFGPAVILTVALAFLTFTGGLARGEVSAIELLELYVIELVLLAGFGYLVYRLTRYLVEHRLPASLDAVERQSDSSGDEGRS